MAGDWIKMRCALTTDPKIAAIGAAWEKTQHFSRHLTCDQWDDVTLSRNALRNAVTGALHAVWSAVNEHGENGFVQGADEQWINDIVGVGEFADAMKSVGWVDVSSGGLLFPKFDSNNTCAAERQKKYRERKKAGSDVTRDVTRDVTERNALRPREEKRREEGIPHTLTPAREADEPTTLRTVAIPPGCSPALAEAIGRWQAWRLAKDGRETDCIRLEMMLAQARSAGWDDAKIVKSIEFSIAKDGNSWLDPSVDFQKRNGTHATTSETKPVSTLKILQPPPQRDMSKKPQ